MRLKFCVKRRWGLAKSLTGLAIGVFISFHPLLTECFVTEVQATDHEEATTQVVEGEVISIQEAGLITYHDELTNFQKLEVKFTNKELAGETAIIENINQNVSENSLIAPYTEYQPGDHVRVVVTSGPQQDEIFYQIDGLVKRNSLLLLLGIFMLVVLVVGRVWGALSLLGLATSFLIIFKFIIPQIIAGWDPILAAVVGSIIIIPVTFYISHGFNTKTHIGVAATLVGLLITGVLATYFVQAAHLTGFASEEAGFLQVERQGTIDIKGLLLAGIIIGTLGILDDITIGQSSTVEQLKLANPKLKTWELFKNAMKVGQDHISSMVNTLVLVYSGSALPLLLLFFDSERTFVDILEFELIAEEIVRMMVGSIGLVLAAPLATALAAVVFTRQKTDD